MNKRKVKLINILGTDWRVVYRDFPPLADGSPADLHGFTDSGTGEIHINTLMPTMAWRDTLLHEVIHALESMLGFTLEERQVRLLATSLRAFFRANPKEAEWLIR